MTAAENGFIPSPSGRVRKRRKHGWRRVFLKHFRATRTVIASA